MKAANRLKAVDDQVSGQNDLGDYHDNGLYYSQHQRAEFAYDANGNLEQDMNRNIGIKYGILHNLPIYLTYRQTGGGGSIATLDVSSSKVDLSDRAASTSYSGTMMNYYTLQGRKLAKKVYNDQHTLTLNESYYDELMLSHRQPARISHADGYVSLDENGNTTFYYYLKDHTSASLSAGLGNVRSVITPDTDGKPQVEQANDYFPFGMSFESKLPYLTKSGSGSNKFKYNSKEEQEMPGKWLDYGKRFYDPAIARWHVIDPRAEKYDGLSPYNYCANNPTNYIDPEGDTITIGNFIDRALSKIGIKTKYVQEVEMDIAQLKLSGDSEVRDMINELEESPREHKVVPTKDEKDGNSVSLNKDKAKKGEKQGTTINYNPDKKTTVAGDFREPRVGLAHEMRHSNDADKGVMNFNSTSNGIPLYEVKAVKTENKVRKAIGAHRRTTYAGKNIPRGMLREDYKIIEVFS